MGAAAQIPLMVKTPEPIQPLQSIGQLMQLRDAGSQIALRNAQTQQAQQQSALITAEAQKQQRMLADQNTIQEYMTADPENARKVGLGQIDDLAGKITPDSFFNLKSNVVKAQQAQTTLTSDQMALQEKAHADLIGVATGLKSLKKPDGTPDLEAMNEALPGAIQDASARGLFSNAGIKQLPPTQISDPKQLDQYLAQVGLLQGVNEGAQKLAGEQAEAAQKTAQANYQSAQAERQRLVNGLIQKGQAAQQTGQNPIDAVLPASLDSTMNASYKAAFQNAMSMPPDENGRHPAADAIVSAAAQHASAIATANNPLIRKGEVDKAVAVESATAPIKVNEQVQAELAKARLGPGAVSGIMDPVLQRKVIDDWTKARGDYQTKVGDAERLQAFVDAARNGNQNASAMLPVAELREIVNRVNTTELNAAGGSVSLLRKLQNTGDKAFEGKPSEDTLRDISAVGQMILNSGRTTLNGKIGDLNTLGAKFPQEPAPATSVLPTGHKVGDSVHLKNGQTVTIKTINPDGTFDY